jgi:hypothetical protein
MPRGNGYLPIGRARSTLRFVPDDLKPIPNTIRGWRKLALWPLALLVRCWCGSLRMEIPADDRRILEWSERPVAFVLWHNRLFISAEIFRRFRDRRLCGLVSASRDGAWLVAFYSLMGMEAARGSSSRFGREAAGQLAEALRSGLDIGVTPDGPRGPCYDFKEGALIVARRARAPLLLFGAEFVSAWRLRSWDGFYLPRPFSTVRLRCERIDPETLADRADAAEAVAARLRELNPDRGP